MRPFLLDADAFLCLRKLGLLERLVAGEPFRGALHLTEYVAFHELSPLRREIDALVGAGALHVHPVAAKAYKRTLQSRARKERMHKGEAEAITWALGQPESERPVFVSIDRDARRAAARRRLDAFDALDVGIAALEMECLTRTELGELLSIWDDETQELGRPGDWRGLPATYAARLDEVRRVMGLSG